MENKGSLNRVASLILVAAAVVLIILTGFCTAGFAKNSLSWGRHLAGSIRDVQLLISDTATLDEPVTFIVYGIDAGEWVGGSYREGIGRADTIVLVKTYPADKKAAVLSIPRDTLVEIPGRPGDDKINHSYAFGQAELLRETVELFTGVEVDYHIGLNYLAFKDIVDLLGGVEFEIDREIRSRGRTLQPGLQMLDGDDAFAVVSTRQDPMGDIDRVRRQQRFIKAVGSEARGRGIDEIFYVILGAWKHLDTDVNLMEALALTLALQGLEDEDISMALVPGTFYNRSGISYWRPYRQETAQILAELFLTGDEN